jgi:endonuclease YncB( thermonuclease family)
MGRNKQRALVVPLSLLILLGTGFFSTMAGKVFSGKVTEVRSADVIVVDYGPGRYVVAIAGISPLKEGPLAAEGKKLVTEMVLGKEVRARFLGRDSNGDMVSQVFVGEPGKDVGLELVRAGLAQRQQGPDPQFGYKYDELSKAENDAREAKQGLWAPPPPR